MGELDITPIGKPDPGQQTYGTKVTQFAFLMRFTPAERKRIKAATATDQDVDDIWTLMTSATYIDFALLPTQQGVGLLASKSLLDVPQHGGATRAGEILQSPITDPLELPGSVRVSYGLPEIP